MPQALIHLEKKVSDKIDSYSDKWNMNKHETILRMLREYVPIKEEVEDEREK